MSEFPRSPVAPAVLIETYLPAALATTPRPVAAEQVTLSLGVSLVGDDGGEWVFDLRAGEVVVRAGSRADTAFSYVQTVEDWRGALWEGRGGAVGRGVAALFHPGAPELETAAGMIGSGVPALIGSLRELRGLLRVVVNEEGRDWCVALQLGPGEIPSQATTEVCVSAEDVDRMATGELQPIEAFMAGRIRILGDMGLVFQMQAAQLDAASGGTRRG